MKRQNLTGFIICLLLLTGVGLAVCWKPVVICLAKAHPTAWSVRRFLEFNGIPDLDVSVGKVDSDARPDIKYSIVIDTDLIAGEMESLTRADPGPKDICIDSVFKLPYLTAVYSRGCQALDAVLMTNNHYLVEFHLPEAVIKNADLLRHVPVDTALFQVDRPFTDPVTKEKAKTWYVGLRLTSENVDEICELKEADLYILMLDHPTMSVLLPQQIERLKGLPFRGINNFNSEYFWNEYDKFRSGTRDGDATDLAECTDWWVVKGMKLK